MSIGARIKGLRMDKGWTQSELAKYAGVSQPTVSSYENEPGLEHRAHILFKIAAALEVSPEYLKTGTGPTSLKDLKSDQKALLSVIEQLDDEKRALLLSLAKTMI